ncbi:hypothetical protein LTR06_008385, partial [Exophiala xenobiotica]
MSARRIRKQETKTCRYNVARDLTPSGEIERIFLQARFKVWLPYFLTKQRKVKHYEGKKAHLQAIAALEQLPDETRKAVANALLETPAHPTVQAQIEKLSNRADI